MVGSLGDQDKVYRRMIVALTYDSIFKDQALDFRWKDWLRQRESGVMRFFVGDTTTSDLFGGGIWTKHRIQPLQNQALLRFLCPRVSSLVRYLSLLFSPHNTLLCQHVPSASLTD